jgi:hypothetical protein
MTVHFVLGIIQKQCQAVRVHQKHLTNKLYGIGCPWKGFKTESTADEGSNVGRNPDDENGKPGPCQSKSFLIVT